MILRSLFSKWRTSHLLLYLVIVLIPSLLISTVATQWRINVLQEQETKQALHIASLHKNYVDRFISEIITSIETMAISSYAEDQSFEQLQAIFERAQQKDARLSGIYYYDIDGNTKFGSNALLQPFNVSDHPFFKELLETRNTTISNAYYEPTTGRYIITIATPLLDDQGEIKAVIAANLRVRYVATVLEELTPDESVKLLDENNKEIFHTGKDLKTEHKTTIDTQLERVPWTVSVATSNVNQGTFGPFFAFSFFGSFIVMSVLFLNFRIRMLKRQALQERIQNEAQKLELVGTLAASTAHEIRNPLTGIKGLVALLSEKHKGEQDQFYFSVIQTEIERINEIVSEFLILGKPVVEKQGYYHLQQILSDVTPIIKSEANLHNIEVITTLPPEPLYVLCTRDHLKQVVLNLAKNALDSMPEGGTLTLSLSKRQEVAILHVQDTGTGISKEILSKIFHPFFTMKDTGTGLGLVVCKRIIEAIDGTIEIDSTVGKGTNVIVTIPIQTEHTES
ncbi:PAS domain-containing sensor histidine kinase [Priestia filamentosa]|uniref:PAS domain-containing sensor histidine kinase n=1 Tax=Priestia filamentosa TaxID=1402861 RepID=UPI0002FD8DA0|nr:PAS domain-containing sensor histidine kinase [Priestia filamentosa]MDT3761581.1 ATP-binding protein [Priestia filamentosa]OXS67681.1 hypothetical protein B1B01_13965 [Priestia filamentosa]WRU96104.1 ATP-binding protein [Priestia filamentosa]SMF42730.1 two-component system, sporulation sensor kinase D [Priestia filamentosa]